MYILPQSFKSHYNLIKTYFKNTHAIRNNLCDVSIQTVIIQTLDMQIIPLSDVIIGSIDPEEKPQADSPHGRGGNSSLH